MHNKRMLLQSPLIICLTASLFFFYEAIQITMFNSFSVSITATGMASILVMRGGSLFKILFGWILDLNLTWAEGIKNGIRLYTYYGFHIGLSVLCCYFFIVFFVALYISKPMLHNTSLALKI